MPPAHDRHLAGSKALVDPVGDHLDPLSPWTPSVSTSCRRENSLTVMTRSEPSITRRSITELSQLGSRW